MTGKINTLKSSVITQKVYFTEKFGNRDYLLVIETASMEEDAEYSVLAKNIAGEVRSSAQLIVEPKHKPGMSQRQ